MKAQIWLTGVIVALLIAYGLTVAVDLDTFAMCVALAFLVQWVVFVPAFMLHSEHFYDLVGSLTYLTVTAVALLLALVALVWWAVRAITPRMTQWI